MSIEKRKRLFISWRYFFFLVTKLPMCLLAGVKVNKLSEQESATTVPYNFINKNPFNSMYFAVQAMAAELSTGTLVFLHLDQSKMSVIVTGLKAEYLKKAKSKITFVCKDGDKIVDTINQASKSYDSFSCSMTASGFDSNNDCVSKFEITWSLKRKK